MTEICKCSDAARANRIAARMGAKFAPNENVEAMPITAKREDLAEVEARVMQEWQWGNLTKLGVANHLRRGGFRQDVAVAKANAMPITAHVKGDGK